MPIQLNQEDGGKILVVHVSGKLSEADYVKLVPEFELSSASMANCVCYSI